MSIWTSNVITPLITTESPVYSVPCMPPPDDWPVSVDGFMRVINRVGDPIYDLSVYDKVKVRIRFDDSRISALNRRLWQRMICWFMWGNRAPIRAATIGTYALTIKPVFLLASNLGISACDLSKQADFARILMSRIPASSAYAFLAFMEEFCHAESELGFCIFDKKALKELRKRLPDHQPQQTVYIPPRIWLYQVTRLKACLDDFVRHQKEFEDLFMTCLKAYVSNYGSITSAAKNRKNWRKSPFSRAVVSTGGTYVGRFIDVAQRLGVHDVLAYWMGIRNDDGPLHQARGINRLAAYFHLIQLAGQAYLLNFTAMRSAEAHSLRSSCLVSQEHPDFGTIHLIRGVPRKQVNDDELLWVTTSTAKIAIQAMESISWLRSQVASFDQGAHFPTEYRDDPLLMTPAYEPWGLLGPLVRERGPQMAGPRPYLRLLDQFPRLFDKVELTITDEDLQIARLITPSLDPEIFAVGKIWPLSHHQLRRTATVNMVASDVVDLSAIQFQLKHIRREQSLYYCRGASGLRLNKRAQEEHLRAVCEMIAHLASQLIGERYVSPLGGLAKERILKLMPKRDMKSLMSAAKRGELSIRKTLFGLCTRRGPCPYGGFDNVSQCGFCAEALVDRNKQDSIQSLSANVTERLRETPQETPRRKSLEAQQSSIQAALHATKS